MKLPKPEKIDWPRGPYSWIEARTLYVSVPFTWNVPQVVGQLRQHSMLWDQAVVGGPAVQLMPRRFAPSEFPGIDVTIGRDMPGVLQRINPLATRTTLGCTQRCGFCAIGKGIIEGGGMVELEDWPDLPVICDNNLLAASQKHFERVIDRLMRWGWADFNQGIAAWLITPWHARRLAEIGKPTIRLALDSNAKAERKSWERGFDLLRSAGVAKCNIRSFCLIGFNDGPQEAWERCEWVQARGIEALPMWYHPLDALRHNEVTAEQMKLGWSDFEYRKIMGWFYKHREVTR